MSMTMLKKKHEKWAGPRNFLLTKKASPQKIVMGNVGQCALSHFILRKIACSTIINLIGPARTLAFGMMLKVTLG